MNRADLDRARAAAPRAMRPAWASQSIHLGVTLLVLAALGGMAVDLDLKAHAFVAGLGKLGRLASTMIPPNDGGDLARIVRALAETFAMAFAGTVIAALVALIPGVVGAKTVVRQPAAHFAFRRVLDVFRGVPALVWALIFVAAFGLGPFGGVLALALADIPSLAKLYAEAIENCDDRPMEGLRASGAGPTAVLRLGLLPQVAPVMASQTLFFLEGNFRHAAVLGIVGAGGIGFELEERIRTYAFDQMAFIVILYVICVAALDMVSRRVRAMLA